VSKHEALFVRYCAKDFLDGTQSLSVMEELAYRRICDLIYVTGNRLEDDDHRLGWMTKMGRSWPRIKLQLVLRSKIHIDQGFIRNERCTLEVGLAAQKREAGTRGGKATAASGKSLENLQQGPKRTWKHNPEATSEAGHEANHLTTKPFKNPPLSPKGGKRYRENGSSGAPPYRPYPNGANAELPEPPWRQRIASFRKSGFWLADWGPKPGEPGCYAPASLLA
jgi:uncharacterized protein YdaU (DUF1376 family)